MIAMIDKLEFFVKERSKYITDRDMIAVKDKIEELVRALRKHIVRLDIE